MYVGRKYFTARLRGRVRESNWRNYYGSCKPLTFDVNLIGKDRFTREVLSVHLNKRDVKHAEVEAMFARDVLKALLPNGQRAYYNGNILARWYGQTDGAPPASFEHTAEAKAKMSAAKRGTTHSEETKAKISAGARSRVRVYTDEGRARISAASKRRMIDPDQIEKLRLSRLGKVHSEDAKKAMRMAKLGKSQTKEHKMKSSEAKRKVPLATIAGIKADIAAGMIDLECVAKWDRPRRYINDIRRGRIWKCLDTEDQEIDA